MKHRVNIAIHDRSINNSMLFDYYGYLLSKLSSLLLDLYIESNTLDDGEAYDEAFHLEGEA